MKLKLPENFSPEERGQMAEDYFRKGYNCCQAVILSFSDIIEANAGTDSRFLASIGSGFGGGMGRMREVCGGFSGMVMAAGLILPADNPSDMQARTANYSLVQEFAAEFKEKNGGSIICRELLGLGRTGNEEAKPSERTGEYYKKRPCPKIVAEAASIVARKSIALQDPEANSQDMRPDRG